MMRPDTNRPGPGGLAQVIVARVSNHQADVMPRSKSNRLSYVFDIARLNCIPW